MNMKTRNTGKIKCLQKPDNYYSKGYQRFEKMKHNTYLSLVCHRSTTESFKM